MLKYACSYDIMDEPTAAAFIVAIDHMESMEDPRVWSKAVRSVLIEFNYDPSWVNGHFREMLEEFILDSSNT